MKKINTISNRGKQTTQLLLDDGSVVVMELKYVDNNQGWMYSLTHSTSGFSVVNRRIVNSPNLLRAFRNVIDWGISCTTTDLQEPIFLDDFYTGRASLYLLNETDVSDIEELIRG